MRQKKNPDNQNNICFVSLSSKGGGGHQSPHATWRAPCSSFRISNWALSSIPAQAALQHTQPASPSCSLSGSELNLYQKTAERNLSYFSLSLSLSHTHTHTHTHTNTHTHIHTALLCEISAHMWLCASVFFFFFFSSLSQDVIAGLKCADYHSFPRCAPVQEEQRLVDGASALHFTSLFAARMVSASSLILILSRWLSLCRCQGNGLGFWLELTGRKTKKINK